MQFPAVTILILNWNGKSFLEKFLPSVAATRYPDFKILVADNGSTDDSVAFIKKNFPTIQVAELGENFGFAGGNNRALPFIHTPYYVLLNSDVEVDPAWLSHLVETMEINPDAASAQPKLLTYSDRERFEYAGGAGGWMDALGYPFCRGRIFDVTEIDQGQYDDPAEIFWSSGACMIVRKSVSDHIGLFEEKFFAHHEEIDFCWRARNKGYRILYSPKAKVWHVGGGTLNRENPRKTYLNVRNSLISMYLNLPPSGVWFKIFMRLTLDGVWGIRALLQGHFKTIPAILKGHFHFYGSMKHWSAEKRRRYPNANDYHLKGPGFFPGSIVWLHFARGKKKFSELSKKG